MDSTNLNQDQNNNGYIGYGNGNHDSDFETQFRNMVTTPTPAAQQLANPARQMGPEMPKKDRQNIILIVMAFTAVVGLAVVIWLTINYLGQLAGSEEDEEIRLALGGEGQDDEGVYKDLAFSENNSNAPLLVYAAVKNGETVSSSWLEEFKGASERYSEKYTNRQAIPSGVTFGNVSVETGLVGELFPNMSIMRFLLETSGGCARFDFYEDLLVLYDYEFSHTSCQEVEWDYLSSGESQD